MPSLCEAARTLVVKSDYLIPRDRHVTIFRLSICGQFDFLFRPKAPFICRRIAEPSSKFLPTTVSSGYTCQFSARSELFEAWKQNSVGEEGVEKGTRCRGNGMERDEEHAEKTTKEFWNIRIAEDSPCQALLVTIDICEVATTTLELCVLVEDSDPSASETRIQEKGRRMRAEECVQR